MQVVRCTNAHRNAWNAFVSLSPRGSFYHRYEWRDINESYLGHTCCYLAAMEHDRIVGVFPLVDVKSRVFGNIACSLPFVNYGGPCGENDEIENALVREAALVAEEWGVDFLEIRSRRHLGPQFPTSEHKVSMTVALGAGEEAMWKAFKTEHRQHIRHGYKNGFAARLGGVELIDEFYEVLSEAWRDMGTPIYSKRYFEAVARVFHGQVRVCVVSGAGRPAATSLQAYDGKVAEGLWLGMRARERHDYAGYVLYWELMKDAAAHGCTHFHLGRSTTQSGGETFKKKWNAYPTQLYWQYILRTRAAIPQINVNNPRYKIGMFAWRHLPTAVTTIVGPMLARCIP